MPPVLSGREEQQAKLSLCLARLQDGKPPPHNVVLLGPRGNGKTALLNWFEGECDKCAAVEATALTPSDIPDLHKLAAALAPPSAWSILIPGKVRLLGTGFEWQPRADTQPQLTKRLIARCLAKPRVLLLDEAHTLDATVGRTLLNASQQVRAKAPFLLVLAGTPGLPSHLATMDATFWDRLGTGRLGVGLLTKEAAAQALREPLESRGATVDDDALTELVEESQCYPYFVQLWGEAIWENLSTARAADVTAETVAAARPGVLARVIDYYQDRYDELETAGLLGSAAAVATIFAVDADHGASDQDIDHALASTIADARERLAAREALHHRGYIWRPPGQRKPAWYAGIPSLMSHVQQRLAGRA